MEGKNAGICVYNGSRTRPGESQDHRIWNERQNAIKKMKILPALLSQGSWFDVQDKMTAWFNVADFQNPKWEWP